MKKSFKKAIAVLLAVLMVVLSVPFTALAAVGDYTPDLTMQFGTFHADGTGWTDYSASATKGSTFDYCGIYDVPVEYDYTIDKTTGGAKGTLYIDAAKSAKAAETLGCDPLTEDYQLGVGDYFTATLKISDIKKVHATMASIIYSENIEPAGYYTYGRGSTGFGSLSDAAANNGKFTVGGEGFVANSSSYALYGPKDPNYWDDADTSEIVSADRMIKLCMGTVGLDVTETTNEYFANPNTGELTGYTYNDEFIFATFAFKIVGEGPISFHLYDPDNTKLGAFEGCYYICDNADGIANSQYTTYAPNSNVDYANPDGNEMPGSMKMTFFGYNMYADTGCDHATTELKNVKDATCTEAGYTGDYVCTNCGETVTAGREITALGHDFTGTVVSDNAGKHSHQCVRYAACNTLSEAVACTFGEMEVVTPPTYDTEGKGKYTCTECGYSYEVTIPVQTCDHNNTVLQNVKDATCTEEGYTGDTFCNDCQKTIATGTVIEKLAHTAGEPVTTVTREATCTVPGESVTVVKCTECDTEISKVTNEIPVIAHTPGEAERVVVKEPTCTAKGEAKDVVKCTVCKNVISETPVELDMIAHTAGEAVTTVTREATCTVPGESVTVVKCTECDTEISREVNEIPVIAHTPGEVQIENVKAPTVDADGSHDEVIYCTECTTELDRKTVTDPMLKGYTLTIGEYDSALGNVTVNGADAASNFAKKFEVGEEVTLTANAIDGAKFVGWIANDLTTVSTDAEFVVKVLANVTYTPVFAVEDAETFAVTFVDAYGNVVDIQEVASGAEIQIPAAPERAGYSFATDNGWSMTNDEIAALSASATITAQYVKNEADKFTVTANGCDITIDGATVQHTATDVAYDTLVTVSKADATAWEVNGVTVAYGNSYTFYVGSDIELAAVTDAVQAVPTVANVSVTETGAPGAVRATFLATRSMTDDCKLINAGFVYGKGDLGAITLDDVDGSAVKAAYVKTNVEQFSLTYGLKAQTGTVTARAFIAYVNADGDTEVVYAEPQTYTYA